MKDIILETRRDALRQALNQAMPPSLDDLHLNLDKVKPLADLWNDVFLDITNKFQELTQQLDAIDVEQIGREDIATAWQRYASIQHECERVLGECLVLIGGLVLRDKGLDQGMCKLADELIEQTRKSYRDSPPTFTVPAPQEAMAQTLGRIIRLRYPEWSVWTLPLAAHEYGHVLLYHAQDQTLKYDLKEVLKKFPREDEGLLAQIDRATPFLNVLLADAFAAYAMGPAYAFSVVLLRLSPVNAFQERKGQPADARRACVIFKMLDKMNSERGEPFGNAVQELEKDWGTTLSILCPEVGFEEYDSRCLSNLATDAWTLLTKMLPELEYPTQSWSDGWSMARAWSEHWGKDLKDNKQELSLPDSVSFSNKLQLRDAINAAWLCRRKHPDQVDKIANAAKDLCQTIVNPPKQNVSDGDDHDRLSPEDVRLLKTILQGFGQTQKPK